MFKNKLFLMEKNVYLRNLTLQNFFNLIDGTVISLNNDNLYSYLDK